MARPGESGPGDNAAGRGKEGTSEPGKPVDEPSALPPDASGQVPQNPGDSIAPDSQGSNLVIRKIKDLLDDGKVTPAVEKQLGMTRNEMEQFVKRYDRNIKRPPAGPGRDITVNSQGVERKVDPNRRAPEALPNVATSNSNQRSGSGLPTDTVGNLAEGYQATPPKSLQSRFDAYRSSLGRSTITAPPKRPAASSTNNGGTR